MVRLICWSPTTVPIDAFVCVCGLRCRTSLLLELFPGNFLSHNENQGNLRLFVGYQLFSPDTLKKKIKKNIKPDFAKYEEKWSSLTIKSLRTIPIVFPRVRSRLLFPISPWRQGSFCHLLVFGVKVSLSMQNSLPFHLHRALFSNWITLVNKKKSENKRYLRAYPGGKSCLGM